MIIIGTKVIRNQGVSIVIKVNETRARKLYRTTPRTLILIPKSAVSISFVNLFKIRPNGVVSNHDIGAANTLCNI